MKKLSGVILILAAMICFGVFFFTPHTREESEILARQADYGGVAALSPKPRTIFLYAGIALGAIGGALLKNS